MQRLDFKVLSIFKEIEFQNFIQDLISTTKYRVSLIFLVYKGPGFPLFGEHTFCELAIKAYPSFGEIPAPT